MSHGPKCFRQHPEECLLQCQGFNSFAPCNSLHSTNSTYRRHDRGKVEHMSKEPFTLNIEPSPHWSYPQVVDEAPLPRLPKETGWPHCHQAQSVIHHNPELHQVQDCLLTIQSAVMCLRGPRSPFMPHQVHLPGGPPPGPHPPGPPFE